jgi:hypothetical protein
MRHTLKVTTTALLVFGLALSVFGCDYSTSSTSTPSPQVPDKIPMETLPEAEQYRSALDPSGKIVWTVAGSVCKADAGAIEAAGQAVESMGSELAQVDYAALALPRFVTVTQKLKLDADSWRDAKVELDACGSEGGKAKWQVFGVEGPEFEQLPNQLLVHRWPHVYVLYDVEDQAVQKLVATIRGYVLE